MLQRQVVRLPSNMPYFHVLGMDEVSRVGTEAMK